jgi:hypothetical protein
MHVEDEHIGYGKAEEANATFKRIAFAFGLENQCEGGRGRQV